METYSPPAAIKDWIVSTVKYPFSLYSSIAEITVSNPDWKPSILSFNSSIFSLNASIVSCGIENESAITSPIDSD